MAAIEFTMRLTAEGWQTDAGAGLPATAARTAGAQPRVLRSGAAGPALAPAEVLCWDDFLPRDARDAVFDYVTRDVDAYVPSTVYTPTGGKDVDVDTRRSLVRREDPWVRERMGTALDAPMRVARRFFRMENIPFGRFELQVAASGEGDFFVRHCDDSNPELYGRMLTYIYYLHRHPRSFSGGALRVYDSEHREGAFVVADTHALVEPVDNRLVMFPADRFHEVSRVDGPTPEFADRRITINGWYWAQDGVLAPGPFGAPPASG